jgi:hypothetical protein
MNLLKNAPSVGEKEKWHVLVVLVLEESSNWFHLLHAGLIVVGVEDAGLRLVLNARDQEQKRRIHIGTSNRSDALPKE